MSARRKSSQSGLSTSLAYASWAKMVDRCTNPRCPRFATYGAIGIDVNPEWVGDGGFLRFLAHVGERPSASHTIDRIDNAIGYWPGNVRWATKKEQAINRSMTILIEIDGVSKCAADWAEGNGIDRGTAYARIKHGWPHIEAVTRPIMPFGQVRKAGPRNRRTRLNDDIVREIRAAWDEAEDKKYGAVARLSRRFGMCPVIVRNVAIRRTWSHLP